MKRSEAIKTLSNRLNPSDKYNYMVILNSKNNTDLTRMINNIGIKETVN